MGYRQLSSAIETEEDEAQQFHQKEMQTQTGIFVFQGAEKAPVMGECATGVL